MLCCGYRHSNVRCDDDAASCIREAAIKFADQNEDGPLDLILLTGRTALARSSNTLLSIMNLNKPADIRDACHRDPFLYVSDLRMGRLHQHNIGYTADGFYRSDDPTNSVKALKEGG